MIGKDIIRQRKAWFTFDNLSFWFLFLLVGLFPLITWPGGNLGLAADKSLFLAVTVSLAFATWLCGRLEEGRLSLPKSLVFLSSLTLVLTALISALVNPPVALGIFGFSWESGTVASLALFVVLMFLGSVVLNSPKRWLNFFLVLFSAFGLLCLSYFVSQFWPAARDFLGLDGQTSSLLGGWNNTAIFLGLILLLALLIWELWPLGEVKFLRSLLVAIMILAVLGLVLINFYPIWLVLGAFSLLLLAYSLVESSPKLKSRRLLRASTLILLLCLTMAVLASPSGIFSRPLAVQAHKLGVSQVEARPSWGATILLIKDTWQQHPLFGVGPERFTSQWLKARPAPIMATPFWASEFTGGYGLVPSMAVTGGGLGLAAWLFFLGSFLYLAGKIIWHSYQERSLPSPFILLFLCGSLYLWLFAGFYQPNSVILALAFLFTGLLVSATNEKKPSQFINLSLNQSRISFALVLGLVILLLGSITTLYFAGQRFWSLSIYEQGLKLQKTTANLPLATSLVARAAELSPTDRYYRALSEIGMARLNQLAVTNLPPVELQRQFAALSLETIGATQQATTLNPSSYRNWGSQAQVYETLFRLGVEDAYNKAGQAYTEALKLNPLNPDLMVNLARLELARPEGQAPALGHLQQALALRPNYPPAVSLQAEIKATGGDLGGAAAMLEQAVVQAPDDFGLWFQLGYLRYRQSLWPSAIQALEQASNLNPNYSNALYFLGLAYDKVGESERAAQEFEQLKLLNPGNPNVEAILERLYADKPAL